MNKLSLILAVALATSFTLTTSCGEKTQTPEQLAARQKQIIDSIIDNAPKAPGGGIIVTKEQAAILGTDTAPRTLEEGMQERNKLKAEFKRKKDSIEAAKASRNAGK